jgi:hypothetical protein
MVTNVFGNQRGQCLEDHSSGLLNRFQTFAYEVGVSVPQLM